MTDETDYFRLADSPTMRDFGVTDAKIEPC